MTITKCCAAGYADDDAMVAAMNAQVDATCLLIAEVQADCR